MFQDRFLNVPPVRLPGEGVRRGLDDLTADGSELRARLLAVTDGQGQEAARLSARYPRVGLPPDNLVASLAEIVIREAAAFHTFQMCEAAIRLWRQWDGAPEGDMALVALARYAAAHAPTQRLAERLPRGKALHAAV